MTLKLVSNAGQPVIELGDWVASKNSPELNALFQQHLVNFDAGKEPIPGENPALDALYEQFFAETNQTMVNE